MIRKYHFNGVLVIVLFILAFFFPKSIASAGLFSSWSPNLVFSANYLSPSSESGEESNEINPEIGYGIGLLMDIPVFGKLGSVQPSGEIGAFYLQRKFEVEGLSEKELDTMTSFLYSGLIKLKFFKKTFSLGLGAYFNISSGKIVREQAVSGESETTFSDFGLERFDYGGVFQMGYYWKTFSKAGMTFDLRYYHGLFDASVIESNSWFYRDFHFLVGFKYGD